jgi:hypothetical protein
MNLLWIHSIIAPVAVGVPLLVVLIARSIVQRDSKATRRSFAFSWSDFTALTVVTVLAWAAFAVWLILDAPAIAAGVRGPLVAMAEVSVSVCIFWLFAAPVLGKIERVARSSVEKPVAGERAKYRVASLRPRKVSSYLPLPLRVIGALICVIALVYVAVQISVAGPHARLIMPIGYAAVAATFFFLYEVWIREEALGAQTLGSDHTSGPTPEEAESIRRRRVREISLFQNILTLVFSVMASAAIGIAWESPDGWITAAVLGVNGAIVGGAGCAFALTSELGDRYLRLAVHKP